MAIRIVNLRLSSQIRDASYDPDSQELTISFQRGGIYKYSGVPEDIVGEWERSDSAGKYFQHFIKFEYLNEQVG